MKKLPQKEIMFLMFYDPQGSVFVPTILRPSSVDGVTKLCTALLNTNMRHNILWAHEKMFLIVKDKTLSYLTATLQPHFNMTSLLS